MHLSSKSGSQWFQDVDTAPAGFGRGRGGKELLRCSPRGRNGIPPRPTRQAQKAASLVKLIGCSPRRRQAMARSLVLIDIACDGDSITLRPLMQRRVSHGG